MGHTHNFDPISGWCFHCNYRDDGRLTSPAGEVWHAGTDDRPDFPMTAHLEHLTQLQKELHA